MPTTTQSKDNLDKIVTFNDFSAGIMHKTPASGAVHPTLAVTRGSVSVTTMKVTSQQTDTVCYRKVFVRAKILGVC